MRTHYSQVAAQAEPGPQQAGLHPRDAVPDHWAAVAQHKEQLDTATQGQCQAVGSTAGVFTLNSPLHYAGRVARFQRSLFFFIFVCLSLSGCCILCLFPYTSQ